MLKAQFFSGLLQQPHLAIVAVDAKYQVSFWNKGAECLFGYTEAEVLGKRLPFLTTDSEYEFQIAYERILQGKAMTFRSQKRNKYGEVLDLFVHAASLYEDDHLLGMSLIFHDTAFLKKATFVPYTLTPFLRESKRTFQELRDVILLSLFKGKMTINQIAHASGINWRTVEKHLTYLIGKKFVREVFSSEYVRIFELDIAGKDYVAEAQAHELSKMINVEKP
ncbi:PAS domain S-box protein [Candidatus Woesearchaeota archaeon]|nr:PAS domain S-box protein [Candidatus Woesearchaeota archaeon]